MLKTFKTALFAALFAVVSFSAQAEETTGNSFNFTVQGTIPAYCEVTPRSNLSATETIDLEDTGDQFLGQLTYTCNLPEGFTRTISSANGGTLNSGNTAIPYELSSGGGSGGSSLGFGFTSLSTDIVDSHGPFPEGQNGALNVRVPSLPGNALAGVASDVITVSIAGN